MFFSCDEPMYEAFGLIGMTVPYGSIASLLYQDGAFEVAGSAIIDGTPYFQVKLCRGFLDRDHDTDSIQWNFVHAVAPLIKEALHATTALFPATQRCCHEIIL